MEIEDKNILIEKKSVRILTEISTEVKLLLAVYLTDEKVFVSSNIMSLTILSLLSWFIWRLIQNKMLVIFYFSKSGAYRIKKKKKSYIKYWEEDHCNWNEIKIEYRTYGLYRYIVKIGPSSEKVIHTLILGKKELTRLNFLLKENSPKEHPSHNGIVFNENLKLNIFDRLFLLFTYL